MRTKTEEFITLEQSESKEESPGQVLCFVSAKGGTGKTILASTTAYLLLKS